MQSNVQNIALRFGISATQIEPVTASGFSGAGVWRITDNLEKQFSVKRLNNLTADHLAWIHRVLLHTIVCDCDCVPRPQRTDDGMSYLQTNDGLWEVCTWMPGNANFGESPSDAKLKHAMRSLAKFHQSAAQVNFDFRPSPGVKTRIDQLAELESTIASIQTTSQQSTALANMLMWLKRLPPNQLKGYMNALNQFTNQTLPLQPVIRDLRSDHLLFTGDTLTGLIDFDAMQMETIALDLTRSLGSLIPDDVDRWQVALDAYSSVRPIQPAEMELIKILDPINTILSALNWLKWIVVEHRQFENAQAVEDRLQQLNLRLSFL